MKAFKFYFVVSLIGVCIGFLNGCLATLFSARCRSRCFFAQVTKSNIPCTSQSCLACLKPCNERQTHVLPCSLTCELYNSTNITIKQICKDSCEFLKHTHLEDGNATCPEGVSNSQCVLMMPKNVQVTTPVRIKNLENYTISWSGTWPSSVVFVVMANKRRKGLPTDTHAEWTEIKQTTHQSIQVYLQPLHWYQFKVAAANQFGASSFSMPSRLIFANPRPPQPPRDFSVAAMKVVNGSVHIRVVWKKPASSFGLPTSTYRLSWSIRLDKQLDKFVGLRVMDVHVSANSTEYTITELVPNTTYILELRAMARYKRRRLRSKRIILRIRTADVNKGKGNVQKKKPLKNTDLNKIFKKASKSIHSTEIPTKYISPTDVLTSSNGRVFAEVKRQKKSVGRVNRVSWLMLTIIIIVPMETVFLFLR